MQILKTVMSRIFWSSILLTSIFLFEAQGQEAYQRPLVIFVDVFPRPAHSFLISPCEYESWFGNDYQLAYIVEPHLKRSLELRGVLDAQVCVVSSYQNQDEMLECARELMKGFQSPVFRIFTVWEAAIEAAAQLRQKLKVLGQTPKNAINFRDKIVMKSRLAEKGVSFPEIIALEGKTFQDAIHFADRVGYPVLFKPRRGMGSRGIRIVKNNQELLYGFKEIVGSDQAQLEEWSLEKFIEGRTYHADGLVRQGKVFGLTVWENFPHSNYQYYREFLPSGSVFVDNPSLFEKVKHFTTQALMALQQSSGVFHLELIEERTSGELFFLETAVRPAGGFTPDAVYQATGIHLIRTAAELELGIDPITIDPTFLPANKPVIGYTVIPHFGPSGHVLDDIEGMNHTRYHSYSASNSRGHSDLVWRQFPLFGLPMTEARFVLSRGNQSVVWVQATDSDTAKEHLSLLVSQIKSVWKPIQAVN